MISLGAGISWAAVSLLNNASIRALSSETGLPCWWPSPGVLRCSHCASCTPHSSVTSSTSSISTPGLSAGEQSNNNTDVECVPAYKLYSHALRLSVGLIIHYESNSLLALEQFALHNCKVKLTQAGYEMQ